MKYALIADIHANEAAFRAVLAKIDTLEVDSIVCLGDVVGYNASPGACIDICREREILSLSGKHDRYVVNGIQDKIRQETEDVITYTAARISPEQLAWLKALPEQEILDNDWLLVHGSPLDKDEYMLKEHHWTRNLKAMKQTYMGLDICFFCHTHFPMVLSKDDYETHLHQERTLQLKRGMIYMINPGSVGQPRDRCPKSSFCTFDDCEYEVRFYRVDYDIENTQNKLIDAGLSPKLARRLAVGR